MMQKLTKNLLKLALVFGIAWSVKYLQDTNYYSSDIERYKSPLNGIIQNKHMLEGEYNIPVFEVLADDGHQEKIILSGGKNDLFEVMEDGDIFIKKENSHYCFLVKANDTLRFQLIPRIPEEVLIEEGLGGKVKQYK